MPIPDHRHCFAYIITPEGERCPGNFTTCINSEDKGPVAFINTLEKHERDWIAVAIPDHRTMVAEAGHFTAIVDRERLTSYVVLQWQ